MLIHDGFKRRGEASLHAVHVLKKWNSETLVGEGSVVKQTGVGYRAVNK